MDWEASEKRALAAQSTLRGIVLRAKAARYSPSKSCLDPKTEFIQICQFLYSVDRSGQIRIEKRAILE